MYVIHQQYSGFQLILSQGDQSDLSNSESDFEADPEELAAGPSSDDESDYGSDGSGSDVSGSDFGGGDDDESDEGLQYSLAALWRCSNKSYTIR